MRGDERCNDKGGKSKMDVHPAHFVAIIGGAVSGSEAAVRLADRGIYSVVFEQNREPYGKIADGLPRWHTKLQAQEKRKIDEKLTRPNIFFVPKTRLGEHLQFKDLVNKWGFSAVLLANGAWKDRPLSIPGAEQFVGKGLVYQNALVKWFNHYHESDPGEEHYEIQDGAIVIGGGLASLDVIKILMLETVSHALRRHNIEIDAIELERRTIAGVLAEYNLTFNDLGLRGCTLFYRRRVRDMPLSTVPANASPERVERAYQAREKILGNFQRKFLFDFQYYSIPTGLIVENDRLVGLTFQRTTVTNGKLLVLPNTEFEVRAPLIVSSIGSIPEPITGIKTDGELYMIEDTESGKLHGFEHVFALGNVVTGKGNIQDSLTHGRKVSRHVMENFLAWREQDYQQLLNYGLKQAQHRIDRIAKLLQENNLLSQEKIKEIIKKIKTYQKKVGYKGDYYDWIKSDSAHTPVCDNQMG